MKYRVKHNTPAYVKAMVDGIPSLCRVGNIQANSIIRLEDRGGTTSHPSFWLYSVDETSNTLYWINKADVELMEGYTEGKREEE